MAPSADDGYQRIPSFLGCLVAIVIIIFLALYIDAKQFQRQESDSGHLVVEPTLRSHFDDSFTFTSEDGFSLAFAVVDYADKQEG